MKCTLHLWFKAQPIFRFFVSQRFNFLSEAPSTVYTFLFGYSHGVLCRKQASLPLILLFLSVPVCLLHTFSNSSPPVCPVLCHRHYLFGFHVAIFPCSLYTVFIAKIWPSLFLVPTFSSL